MGEKIQLVLAVLGAISTLATALAPLVPAGRFRDILDAIGTDLGKLKGGSK